MPFRACFSVDSAGTAVAHEVSDAVNEAYDILSAAGVPAELAALWPVLRERDGHDPVLWARHYLRLREASRRMSQAGGTIRSDGPW